MRGLIGLLNVLRYAVFYPLMWLRPILYVACSGISGLSLLALLIAFVVRPEEHKILWALGGLSFGTFLLGWVYDGLLLWLSPEPLWLDRD